MHEVLKAVEQDHKTHKQELQEAAPALSTMFWSQRSAEGSYKVKNQKLKTPNLAIISKE